MVQQNQWTNNLNSIRIFVVSFMHFSVFIHWFIHCCLLISCFRLARMLLSLTRLSLMYCPVCVCHVVLRCSNMHYVPKTNSPQGRWSLSRLIIWTLISTVCDINWWEECSQTADLYIWNILHFNWRVKMDARSAASHVPKYFILCR